jgi:hypothetical protein
MYKVNGTILIILLMEYDVYIYRDRERERLVLINASDITLPNEDKCRDF